MRIQILLVRYHCMVTFGIYMYILELGNTFFVCINDLYSSVNDSVLKRLDSYK